MSDARVPLVAIEEHWMPAELTVALGALPPERADDSLALNERGDTRERLEDLGVGRLAAMDEAGIDVAVLSLTPPGTGPLDPDEAVALSRAANDTAARAVDEHPTRLRSLSTLPMTAPDRAAEELARAARLGHVGAMVYGRAGGLFLDDPAFEQLFATAAHLGQPIFIHPQIPPRPLREAAYRGLGPGTELALATFGWGWHVEAATAALRLILSGVFDRHPELQLVLGHWGELLAFWLDRADAAGRVAGLERPVSDCMRENVHLTPSGMFSPALLEHALAVTTTDRLMFSTDYPFGRPAAGDVETFLARLPSDDDRAKVASGNAAALFGIALEQRPPATRS